MTFKYSDIMDKPLRFSDISGEPPPRVTEVSPQDEKKQIEDIVDWSDMFEQDILTMQQIYEPVSSLMKSIPDPKDVSIQNEVEVERPMGIRAPKEGEKVEETGVANTLLGFKYPPKPPDWNRSSPIEKFNFITLPISDVMGRVGGKIASDWRMMKKEDVQKLLITDLDESLKWYQKSPEVVGWTAEKVAEFLVLKGVFKASGLHKALTVAGQKAAAPFIAKEITAAGGMKTVSTWSAAGIKGLVRKGMTSFLTAAPENTAFISSWSALDAALKGEPIPEAAVSGAGWGLALTAGFAVIGTATQAPEMRLAFQKAIANVGKRFPGMLDKLGKPVTEEVEKEWLKALSKSRGKDLRIIDLAKRERQMFRNAIRAAEKEILKAADREAAIQAYWTTKASKAATKAKPVTKADTTDIVKAERPAPEPTRAPQPPSEAITTPKEGIEPIAAGLLQETVPLSKIEDAKVVGAAFLLDDGTITQGADTHFGLVNLVPKGRKVVDAGFIDEQGNYLKRGDVIKGITPKAVEKAGGLPEGYKTFDRGEKRTDAYGIEKPVRPNQRYGILTDKGIDTRTYGATPEQAINNYLAEIGKPPIDTRTDWLKRVESGEGSSDDIQAVASDILGEKYGIPQRSAKSEAEYFELDDGRRIRLAQHDVVHKESDVDLVINIGQSQDADITIPTDVTSEKQIRDIIENALEKKKLTPEAPKAVEKPTEVVGEGVVVEEIKQNAAKEPIKPTEIFEVGANLEPPHEIRDKTKFEVLKSAMEKEGWIGRPVLVIDTDETPAALTGSHRIQAAKDVGVEIPVYRIEQWEIDKWVEEGGDFDKFFNDEGLPRIQNELTMEFLKEIGDEKAISLFEEEIELDKQVITPTPEAKKPAEKVEEITNQLLQEFDNVELDSNLTVQESVGFGIQKEHPFFKVGTKGATTEEVLAAIFHETSHLEEGIREEFLSIGEKDGTEITVWQSAIERANKVGFNITPEIIAKVQPQIVKHIDLLEFPPTPEAKKPVEKVEAPIDKQQLESDEIALSDKKLKPIVGETMPKGIADVSNIGAIKQAYNTAHDWILTFGRAKREDPELYDQLMKAYSKRNAGVEKALDQVDKIMPKEIKIDDDVNMAVVYEDKRLSIGPKQKETYNKFKALLDEMSAKQQEEGLFAKPFNERMIEENNIKIEKLTEELKHPNKSKRIADLRAENKVLAEMRYLPHSVVVKRTIESKVNTLSGDQKKTYLDRLSAFYKKRTGKLFLKDYLDADLITKDDMRMSRLAIEEVADYYIRSAYKGLYDYGKEKGYVQPFSEELHDQGWLTAQELGISSPELKEQIVHPLFGSSLAEMKSMRQGRGSLANQIFGMVKQGQFIKPTIVWVYDGVQHYMRGMYSFNPVKEAKSLVHATRSVLEKDELYHKLNESNLFQFPYEISRGARDEEIAKFINQHSAELDRVTKALEKATDTRWFDPDMTVGKMVRNIAMAAHRGMGQLTWAGDKMQRTQSYLILRDMGYPHDEAVKVAANSHGGYSLLSDSYKKFMTKKTFVYSFRFLMPLEMGKTVAEPIIAAKDAMGGKKIPKAHWERMVKAVIATAVVPVATDEYMKWRGFKKEGKHLGPLAWKWSKEVVVDGERREIVVGMNNILNMPVKYWNRITRYNPIDSSNRGVQALKNLAKWEVHPIYRIFGWDVMENRRSFGSGMNVYDTEANTAVQFAQISKYVVGQSFRFFGQTMDAVGEGNMTEKERAEQDKIFESALNDFDKVLFWALGYKYIRQPLKERQAIMMKSLQKELTTRAFQYARKYEGEELEKRKVGLERWARKSEEWIKNEMK